MSSSVLTRPFGTPLWDGIVRGSGAIALLAIPVVLLVPRAAPLAAFALVTIWVHGPMSPFLPAAYEPTLMAFGRLYPPLLIGVVGTLANLYVEFLDYHLFRAMAALGPYRRFQAHPMFARAVRWFDRAPFATTWLFGWSPLPDWMVRMIAPAAGYPVGRYLLALGLGRLPRFWFFAALGAHLRIPGVILFGLAGASAVLTLLLLAWRHLTASSLRLGAAPCGP
jgi:ribonucleoside-triphosphate reductase